MNVSSLGPMLNVDKLLSLCVCLSLHPLPVALVDMKLGFLGNSRDGINLVSTGEVQ